MNTGSKSAEGKLSLRADIVQQLRFFSDLGVSHLNVEKQDRQEMVTLDQVRLELGDCTRCGLAQTRKSIVFGTGSPDADLMFVGEAPGADEDDQGLPFVGRAGQLLTRIIEAIELSREEVYIANILKCRPPGNRDPQSEEVDSCEPFLFRQIVVIRPMIVVALGKYAGQTLLRSKTPISRLRGSFFDFRGVQLMPTFHPSYLLRNPSAKREVWEDMKKVRDELKQLGSRYYE